MSTPSDTAGPNTTLPHWAARLLYRLAPAHNRDVVLGDFAEVFQYIAEDEGRTRALGWYIAQVIKSLPAFLSNGIYFGSVMIGNYLKTATRNLYKRKFYATLNIAGLAIGMAVCLLLFQYVAFETSYDAFHDNHDTLYRFTYTSLQSDGDESSEPYSWFGLKAPVLEAVPEVQAVVRTHPNYSPAIIARTDDTGARKAVREAGENLLYTDPEFLQTFSLAWLHGDETTALTEPGTMVLSASAAERYFDTTDVLGQTLDVRGQENVVYTIVGVFEDVPANSHFTFDFLMTLENVLQGSQYREASGWGWTNFVNYIQLRPDADPAAVEAKLREVLYTHKRESWEPRNIDVRVGLQPITDIHLRSDFDYDEHVGGGSARTVYFFALVALFVLIIAWVNYINLATARALERAREVGVRKVVGARKSQVIAQFLLESALTNALALVLALALTALALPYLNAVAGTDITLSTWREPRLWGALLAVFGAGTLLASLYPAFVLSAFQPVTVLKGTLGTAGTRNWLRQGLVVFQFAASIALLTGTYIVYQQVSYMRTADLGVDLDQVLIVERPGIIDDMEVFRENRSVFREQLLAQAAIKDVAISTTVPGGNFSFTSNVRREAADPSDTHPFQVSWVTPNFPDLYELELLAGRLLDEVQDDDSRGVLVNETLVRDVGFASVEAAVGATIMISNDNPVTVVGVLEDYNWMSVKEAPAPAGLAVTTGGRYFSIKIEGGEVRETVETVQGIYEALFPGNPFEYFFADRFFDEQYRADQRFGTLFGFFSALALVVACLGLIGLAAYATAQRTKEMGVRKVLGASAPSIARLLFAHFAKLVTVALVITAPLMYFAADQWLSGFATRINVQPWLFVVPGLLVLLVALLTVSYHTLRIATLNPVKALRYD